MVQKYNTVGVENVAFLEWSSLAITKKCHMTVFPGAEYIKFWGMKMLYYRFCCFLMPANKPCDMSSGSEEQNVYGVVKVVFLESLSLATTNGVIWHFYDRSRAKRFWSCKTRIFGIAVFSYHPTVSCVTFSVGQEHTTFLVKNVEWSDSL